MGTLTAYKGLDVVEGATGVAGIALTDNFKELADRAPYQDSSNPTTGSDSSAGFAAGDQWLNTTTLVTWVCVSASVGAAVWKSLFNRTSTALQLIPSESSEKVEVFGNLQVNGTGNSSVAGKLGLGTTAPTNSLTISSSGSGTAHFNTADQTTNYEKLSALWASNVAYVGTLFGGTGSARSFVVGMSTTSGATTLLGRSIQFSATPISSTRGLIDFTASTGGTATPVVSMGGTSLGASSGMQYMFGVNPVINQSGTAGYTCLLVNPSQTATGSGAKLLADFQIGGTSKLSLSTSGVLTLADAANITVGTSTGTQIGTSTSQKLGFWNATPVAQQVLATGASKTVDDVITLLQTLGLCRQS